MRPSVGALLDAFRRQKWRGLADYLELRPSLQWIPYLVAALAVGIAAVLYSTVFSRAVEVAQKYAGSNPIFFLVTAPIFFLASFWLVKRFAPAAGGLGVPTVMRTIEQIPAGQAVDPWIAAPATKPMTAVVVIGSSVLAILGGSSLGREGPMVLIAACLFAGIGRFFRNIWPDIDARSWIVAGGAAGIAAAFQTPLAGVVFVLEELAQVHYREFKTYVISAVVISGMIAQWLFGRYLFLGYAKVGFVPAVTVLWAACVGIGCGMLVYAFRRARVTLSEELDRRFLGNDYARVAALALVVAAIAVLAPDTAGGGVKTIETLLFGEERRWILWLFLLRFASTLFSHLTGVAGGFLAPSLALGGLFGAFVGRNFAPDHATLLVLCGMVAFLGAMNRAPFTALIVVMEMTDGHSAIFPLMLAAVAGNGSLSLLLRREKKMKSLLPAPGIVAEAQKKEPASDPVEPPH